MATAKEKTDLFIDPQNNLQVDNAAKLLFKVNEDCLLSSNVTVDFSNTFDAGVLVAYQHQTSWAKLCFERSPQGSPMIVSVVNKGTSDDCNSTWIDGESIYLRIAKMGSSFAFHYSSDGSFWHMMRYFNLESAPTQLGFLVQSPTGDGCEVTFSDIRFQARTLQDIRSGE
jgi:regulation of enolase protein 1 (concanavalin A-like superfamily)